MDQFLKFIYPVFCIAIMISTIHFYYLFLWRTDKFHQFNYRSGKMGLGTYLYCFAVYFGTAACFYVSIKLAFNWIPRNWTIALTEDGSPQWAGTAIAGILSFLAPLVLSERMTALAAEHSKLQNDLMSAYNIIQNRKI